MNEKQKEVSAMYSAAKSLLEASRAIGEYNGVLSNILLLMSDSIITDIRKNGSFETDPDKSNRIDNENVKAIREELGAMIEGVKKNIEEE